jgi:glycerol uptake facilitator-like aquaporin
MDLGMLVSIGMIIASMLAGLLFGLWKKRFSDRDKKILSLAITCMVIVLIFAMGLKTGLNRDVMDNLGSYGLKSLLLALGAIAGSLVLVVAFDRLFLRSVQK